MTAQGALRLAAAEEDRAIRLEHFRRLAELVEARIGIRLPMAKRGMVACRLQRRARELGMESVGAYCAALFEADRLEEEFPHLVNALTTNKTDFFREPVHFEFLEREALPRLLASRGAGRYRPLAAWSAACSTGPEPYTIAMVLEEFGRIKGGGFRYEVYASDIDTDALAEGLRAIYDEQLLLPVPTDMLRRYFMRSRTPNDRRVRVVPELRAAVNFWRMNLLEPDYPWSRPMDIIFCRNVLIYFDRATQQKALEGLLEYLEPGGYLFVGHSETLNGLTLPVRQVAPATYVRL